MRFAPRVVPILLLSTMSVAVSTDRVPASIDSNQAVVLTGSVHPKAQTRYDRGPVEPSMKLPYVTMVVKPSPSQQADLRRLLAQQQDRNSPNYHKWLTPEQYAGRFGLSKTDVDRLSSWLQSRGFSVVQVARGRDWIAFGGTAEAVQNTFRTTIHRFEVDGETHFANATDISIPQALAGTVVGFRGLDDFRLRPMSTSKLYPAGVFFPAILGRHYTSGGGNHFLAPDDIATIYNITPLYNAGIEGTGMKVVVVGQVDVDLTDIQDFRAGFNLPPNDPTVIVVPGSPDPGHSAGDLFETDLDLEWTGAVARNAEVIFVTSTDVFTSAIYAIDQDLAPVISMSYGGCESLNASFIPANEPTMQQASAEGITFINSSGDTGAAACDAFDTPPIRVARQGLSVNYPASSPEVIGVGGTTFSADVNNPNLYWNPNNNGNGGSAIQYIPETSWNDTVERGTLAASGGGKSSCGRSNNGTCTGGFVKPSWQTGLGVLNDGVRDVPDVSITASPDHDGFMVCNNGSCTAGIVNADIVGGTSASAPVFAGIVALLNQFLGNSPPAGLGNINPQLYPLAQDPTNGVFHDVTTGDNKVPCTQGTQDCPANAPFVIGYNAGPGYDLATGLGSVDANNLACHWAGKVCGVVALTVVPDQIDVGLSGPVVLTATVTAGSGSDVPTGTVNFLKDNDPNNPIGSGTLTAGTVSINYDPHTLPAHRYAITAAYGGDVEFAAANSSAVTLTVGTPTTATLSVVPAAVLIGESGPVALTATVSANSGTPTGTVAFHEGSTQLGTGTLTSNTAILNYDPSSLAAGTHRIIATYSGDLAFADSDSPVETLNVQDFSGPVANPSTVAIGAAGGAGTTTITITPIGGFDQTVTFSCSGLPSESSCAFNPATLIPGGRPVSTRLTISTTAPSAGLVRPMGRSGRMLYALLVPGWFGLIVLSSGGRRKLRWLAMIAILVVSTLWLPACGGGSGGGSTARDLGTPAGTSTVTVTAAVGGANPLSHTVQITLTVLQ